MKRRGSRSSPVIGVVVGIAISVIIACGGAPQNKCDGLCKRNEVTALWTQIRGWRAEAHMKLDPAPQDLVQMGGRTVPEAKRVCQDTHQVPTTCNDVCNIADDICDNAERICQINDELGDDDYAREKCTSAKASCREAKQKCCECSASKPSEGTL